MARVLMFNPWVWGVLGALGCAATGASGPPPAPAASVVNTPKLDLPYDAFTLDNGLRVVVHEDRKAPVVAVSVWYGVGSKDEPEGRTGFAHLFEHLMFQGSEHYDDEWFAPLEDVGVTDLNGTTWLDRTNYFQTVPTPALDRVLWMESDRMGHLLGAVTQDKLDEQRGVVQNEKRQGDNQPYGRVDYALAEGLYPVGHPYRHSTIGSMEDLEAADLDTVKAWFAEYYGAANTVIALAGDIDAATARPLMEKYFGHIEAGPALTKSATWVPHRPAVTHDVQVDAGVANARIYRVWATPSRNDREAALTYLVAEILGDGKNSRLYQKLVYDAQLASEAYAFQWGFVLTSQLRTVVTLQDPETLDQVNGMLDELIAEFAANGPTDDELVRAKTKINAGTIRGLEKVGGFGGKGAALAQGELYTGDPLFVQTWLQWINEATAEDVKRAAQQWLATGWHQVDVLPQPKFTASEPAVDRSTGLPGVGEMPNLAFPEIQESTLSNGTRVVFAQRSDLPVVTLAIQFDAGYAADETLGAASFTEEMLDEGTATRSALKISAEAEALGAELSTSTNLDVTRISLAALSDQLEPSVALWADVVRNSSFPQEEIDRVRAQWLAGIEQEKAQPFSLALRLLPPAMFGPDHAYGVPLTGSGTTESITALTRDDLVAFRDKWLRPDNGTIFVVGDTTLEQITSILEAALAGWTSDGSDLPTKAIEDVALPERNRLIVVDRPGAPQSVILAGHVAPSSTVDDNVAIEAMNDAIGGKFSARINMNLREDKSWAYGAYTVLFGARAQRPWIAFAPVQADRTGDSVKELQKEFGQFVGRRPVTKDELSRIVKQRVNELPGSFETVNSVLGEMMTNDRYGRALDHASTLPEAYKALTLDIVRGAARDVVHPESLVWVVVGDRSVVDEQLDGLFDTVEYWTVDGEPVADE
ncbi:MAG: insulinase family protein [Myxococcales bacterium]|nr:insulinase family protein [Myxococcales bacterium]